MKKSYKGLYRPSNPKKYVGWFKPVAPCSLNSSLGPGPREAPKLLVFSFDSDTSVDRVALVELAEWQRLGRLVVYGDPDVVVCFFLD